MKSDISYAGIESLQSATARKNAGTVQIARPEPIIRASDVAYILFSKSDLERQNSFLIDFGMVVAERTGEAIYMRGSGSLPYIYAAFDEQKLKARSGKGARRGYLGIGFSVGNRAELEKLSKATGCAIEPVDGPGGGERVRLTDPDGFIVDVCHGRSLVDRIESDRDAIVANTPHDKRRVNQAIRTPVRPSAIERLGHVVLSASSFETSMQWYMRHLGLIPTDVQCLEDGTPALAFNRLDLGKTPADHHSLVLMQNVSAQYMHSAYETLDLDSIGQGQQHLRAKGWQHFWGIGRHILGSQIFDYWKDPEGDEVEHYADGDVFDADHETRYHPLDMGGLWAWGADVPNMAPKPTPAFLLSVLKALRSGKLTGQRLGQIKAAMSSKPRPWSR